MGKIGFSMLVVALVAIFSGASLLKPGLHPTHDGEYHIVRFYEFDKVLRDGNWYPRWAPDLNKGYGIPLFNYVYPLPNYIASIFHFFGVSFIDSFKLQMFFASLVGGVFFYLWARIFWGNAGGLVASSFYTFSPYHLLDIYIRGSVGEVWALALFPSALWSISQFFKTKKQIYALACSLCLALVVFSHNILAVMFFLFFISFILFLIIQSREKMYLFFHCSWVVLVALSVSAIFWIPALFERGYVTGLEVFRIEEHFPQFYQLLIPSWGSGFSSSDLANQMSFQIGIANLLAVVLSVVSFIFLMRRNKRIGMVILFFIIWFLIAFLLMLRVSQPIWQTFPFMRYFQFPWRFLSLEILFISFLAGSLVKVFRSKIFVIVMILLPLTLGIQYTSPAYYHQRDDAYYIKRSNFIDGTNSPGNFFNTIWMNTKLQKEKEKIKSGGEETKMREVSVRSTEYTYQMTVEKETDVVLNTAYFPGWTANVSGRRVETKQSEDGLITFKVPKGHHSVDVSFFDTPVRRFAKLLTLSSLVLFSVLLVRAGYVKMKR